MTIFTKSSQKVPSRSDGIRICIMRRPEKDIPYDIWMPHLAPSSELLTQYHKNEADWNEFERRFTKEVLEKEKKYLDIINQIAQKYTVSLICFELTTKNCHRRLLLEKLQELYPEHTYVLK